MAPSIYTASSGYTSATASTTSDLVWGSWSVTYNITSSASTSVTWTCWNSNLTSSTTGSTSYTFTNGTAWGEWNLRYDEAGAQRAIRAQQREYKQPSAEERARRAADEKRRQEEYDRKQREALEARERAKRILGEHLSPEQREDLAKKDCFYIETIARDGGRRKYRIDRGTHGNVKRIDEKGSILESLCIQPDGVPIEDSMLAQKLWIETDEEAFRRVANIRRVG